MWACDNLWHKFWNRNFELELAWVIGQPLVRVESNLSILPDRQTLSTKFPFQSLFNRRSTQGTSNIPTDSRGIVSVADIPSSIWEYQNRLLLDILPWNDTKISVHDKSVISVNMSIPSQDSTPAVNHFFCQLKFSQTVRPTFISCSLAAQSYSLDCKGGNHVETPKTCEKDYCENGQ